MPAAFVPFRWQVGTYVTSGSARAAGGFGGVLALRTRSVSSGSSARRLQLQQRAGLVRPDANSLTRLVVDGSTGWTVSGNAGPTRRRTSPIPPLHVAPPRFGRDRGVEVIAAPCGPRRNIGDVPRTTLVSLPWTAGSSHRAAARSQFGLPGGPPEKADHLDRTW